MGFKERRCYECGKGRIRKVATAGRRERYKTMLLEVPAHIGIPTCDQCGTEWADEDTTEQIENALAIVYRERLHSLIEAATTVILRHTTVGRLEELLGLTKGYISRLRSRAKDPRPTLASELALLARDPSKRLKELEAIWDDQAA